MRTIPGTEKIESARDQAGQALVTTRLFRNLEPAVFANDQTLDEDGLLGRVFSNSYVPKDPPSIEKFTKDVRALFDQFQRDGTVMLKYHVSIYLAQKLTSCA